MRFHFLSFPALISYRWLHKDVHEKVSGFVLAACEFRVKLLLRIYFELCVNRLNGTCQVPLLTSKCLGNPDTALDALKKLNSSWNDIYLYRKHSNEISLLKTTL